MASLFQSDGVWMISIYRFGKVRAGKTKRQAQQIFRHVEVLEGARKYGLPPDPATVDWLRNASPKLRKRLATIGLIASTEARTVGDLVEYFEARKASKRRTRDLAFQSAHNLVTFFGRETPLIDIHKADARHFKEWMLTRAKQVAKGKPETGLAPPTVARRFRHVRGMFETARDMDWIGKNPFKGIKAGRQHNSARLYFVTADQFQKVCDELTSPEFRLAFALMRWAGMRQDEPAHLKWTDIDWDLRSMTFRSPKTEHIEGMETRTCPIFVELAPYLEQAFDAASDGAVWCCPVYRGWNNRRAMLEKQVKAAMKRVQIDPWPRLFQNLRATRATEIDNQFGPKNESLWIGHGSEVALRSYLIGNTDDAWQRATGRESSPEESKPAKPELRK